MTFSVGIFALVLLGVLPAMQLLVLLLSLPALAEIGLDKLLRRPQRPLPTPTPPRTVNKLGMRVTAAQSAALAAIAATGKAPARPDRSSVPTEPGPTREL
jgi:hypothetical protein